MYKDYKYGLILGLILAVIALIWLSARSNSSLDENTQPSLKVEQLQKETDSEPEIHIKLDESSPANTSLDEPSDNTYRRFHIVNKGESLSDIANKYYGSTGSWKLIYNANRDKIQDVNKIRPGIELTIPEK